MAKRKASTNKKTKTTSKSKTKAKTRTKAKSKAADPVPDIQTPDIPDLQVRGKKEKLPKCPECKSKNTSMRHRYADRGTCLYRCDDCFITWTV